MADDFDPYYTWLGIPPEDQPADHYRLLGVRRFESNADVITNAMDQRMHYLRSLQVGKRSALSQKILNEVSAAGVILLDPKRRAEYDQQLRAREASAAKAAAPAAKPPVSTGESPVGPARAARPLPVASSLPKAAALPAEGNATKPTVAPQPSAVVVTTAAACASRPASSKSIWTSPMVLGGAAFTAVAVLGLVGMIVVQMMQTPDRDVAVSTNHSAGADKGSGSVKPEGNNSKGSEQGNNKTPLVEPVPPAADAAGWVLSEDGRQLFVLEFDKRASVEIEQSAGWVSLTQNTTIEGWFKLKLDTPQTMSLFGTRTAGNAGAAPNGWLLSARRVVKEVVAASQPEPDKRRRTAAAQARLARVAKEKAKENVGEFDNQLVLELWKSGGQFVQNSVSFPDATQWHHLALVVSDGKEGALYIDGKRAMQFPMEEGLAVSGENLRVGDDASGRGSGMEGHLCGLRISDKPRYQKPFAPPSPLALTHDEPTGAALHFTMAVPNAVAGTIRRSSPQWQYGHGRYDEGTKKVAGFTPMLVWNGLTWRPGPGLPDNVAQWMSLDPLGGHTGNGRQYSVVRRWTAPEDGTLMISGRLTHAHETHYGDGVRGRVVSSATGQAGEWEALFTGVATPVEKLPVRKGDQVDFLVECKNDNHCDKFAWQVQLKLTGDGGQPLGVWESEKNFHGPKMAGAVYQLARLGGARWQRLDPSQAVALTQLAPLPSAAPASKERIDLIQEAFDGHQHMRGEVKREGAALRTKENLPTAFMLPANFPEEYVLEAEVLRESGEDSICFGFPIPGARRMTAIVDGQKGTKSGLSAVNDQQIFTKGNPLVRDGRLLTNGTPAVVRIRVDKSAVELSVNGSSIAKWKVNASDKVLLAKGMGYTNPKAMAVFTWNSPFRINRLELIPQAGSGPSLSPASAEGRIDLVQKHARTLQLVRGSLSHSNAGGWLAQESGTAFMIPEVIPDEYVIEAEVTREDGSGSISFHLPVRGMPLSAIIDIYDARLTGLSDINDWNIQSAGNPTVHRGPVLTNGQPALVRIVVSQQEISLSVDGKKLSSWPYDPSAKLNAFQGLRLPDPRKLGVTTGNSKFRIKRMDLVPASAVGAATNPPLAARSPIDLIDAARRTVRGVEGSFNVSANALTTGDGKTRVVVDHDLPDEYTLEAEITRLSGDDTLGVGFPVQGRPLCILIDGWHSNRSGICMIPGQDASDPGGETIQKGARLTNGMPARLRVAVNRQEVRLEIDDQTVARWRNDPAAALQAFKDYEPEGRNLSITSYSAYRIASLKLIPAAAGSSPPVTPSPPAFAGVKKAPVPDEAAKTKAQTQFAAVFGDELKGAKTPQAKATLARKVSELARETKDLPTKYVMLEEARKLFVDLKDVASVMQTVDVVAQDFDVQPLPAKVKLLETMADGNLTSTQRAEIVAEACSLGYEAIDADNFAVAQGLANVARSAAARATSADVKADAKEFIDEFAQRHKRWDAVRKAEKTLADSPDDKGANLALGLYHLFDRSDQAKGLPLLSKGSDAKLAAAAKARQETVSRGLAASVEEADAWFDCIATAPAEYKAAIQKRALDAYELALPVVEGIEKAKVTKRRDQLKADLASAPAPAAGSKRGTRVRKSDLPESSPGMVGRIILGGKDAGLLVTFNASQRSMDTQKLRNLLTEAKLPGGRIVLEGVLTCPTPMSMRVSHRGASTNATQQILINGKNLSTVGGSRGSYDNEELQLPAGNHLVQWLIDFDGSIGPSLHIYEEGNGRTVALTFNRDQNYGARKLPTIDELDLTDPRLGP